MFRSKKGMIGIEAAIILIAFVIVATAFGYMVINMGMTATQKGKESIEVGLREASSPLVIDGTILLRESNQEVDAIIIPLKVVGVDYVPMGANRTVVSVKMNKTAYPNVYLGVDKNNDPAKKKFDDLVDVLSEYTSDLDIRAMLFLEENNGDDAFDFFEKGYLVIWIDTNDVNVTSRAEVLIEIRPEKSAPLTIEFVVPPNLPATSGSEKVYIPLG